MNLGQLSEKRQWYLCAKLFPLVEKQPPVDNMKYPTLSPQLWKLTGESTRRRACTTATSAARGSPPAQCSRLTRDSIGWRHQVAQRQRLGLPILATRWHFLIDNSSIGTVNWDGPYRYVEKQSWCRNFFLIFADWGLETLLEKSWSWLPPPTPFFHPIHFSLPLLLPLISELTTSQLELLQLGGLNYWSLGQHTKG